MQAGSPKTKSLEAKKKEEIRIFSVPASVKEKLQEFTDKEGFLTESAAAYNIIYTRLKEYKAERDTTSQDGKPHNGQG